MDIIEVAKYVGANYFRRAVHRITSSGSAHRFLPIMLDETGKLDRSLYDDADIGDVLADAAAKTTPVDADTLPLNDSAASNALKKITWANIKAAIKSYTDTLYTDHGALSGRTDDDHTQYALLAGRAGGQTIKGGTAESNSLTLESTNHATKGAVLINPNGGDVAVGKTTVPSGYKLSVNGSIDAAGAKLTSATISGLVTGDRFRTGTTGSINDDTAAGIGIVAFPIAFLLIPNATGAAAILGVARVNNSQPVVLSSNGTVTTYNNTDLTGTTGADNSTNISIKAGGIRLENRSGAAANWTYILFC